MLRSKSLLTLLLSSCCLVALWGCEQDPFTITTNVNLGDAGLFDEAGNPLVDASNDIDDGAVDDGGGDADACVPSNEGVEICDELDNDCNGEVDDVDAAELTDDVANCGECGKGCSFPNAFAKCVDSKCEMDDCAIGFYDIKNGDADGCEYRCQPSNNATEICDEADNDCDGVIDNGFDKQTSLDHCGECGKVCVRANATATCSGGVCSLGPCDEGFASVNQSADDGCEYQCPVYPTKDEICNATDDDCDGLIDEGIQDGADCQTTAFGECKAGKSRCVGGEAQCVSVKTPSLELCNGLDDDCDDVVDNGYNLDTNPLHCGECNKQCLIPNAVPRCVNRVCEIERCVAGFRDLDSNAPGCEHQCEVWPPIAEICNGKDDDCDGVADNGIDITTDVNNCGGCGTQCGPRFPHAAASCVNSLCVQGACDTNYWNIDANTPGCNYFCVQTNGGTEACDGVDNDCDNEVDEDTNTTNDVNNCGRCGNVCSFPNAAASCVNSVCVQGACDAGFRDLNSNEPGCEYQCPVSPATGDETAAVIRCDGVDNDCDGVADEDFPTNEACGNNTAPCVAGTRACTNGIETCVGGVKPQPETCDNVDNDCNTVVDDGFDKESDPRYCGDCTPCNLPHAINRCNAGTCEVAVCELGYVDLIPDNPSVPSSLGCETQCTPTGDEICDGVDNNCDGNIDEGLLPADGYSLDICSSVGECGVGTPAVATCQVVGAADATHPEGIRDLVCTYGATVDPRTCNTDNDCLNVACYNNVCPGELPDDEVTCDRRDNDCDGQIDETFPTWGDTCYETGVLGACRDSGNIVCSTDGTTVECDLTIAGATPTHELCDGKDNDCDGRVDEFENDNGYNGVQDATTRITVASYDADGPGPNPATSYDYYIYSYEASRPGAASDDAGTITTRACSTGGVLPWTSVSFTDAEAACQAIDPNCTTAGRPCWRLCSATEWYLACASASEQTYPYGNSYGASTCNGADNDGDATTGGDQDVLLPTGDKTSCVRSGVFDMSGNAREWTADPRSDGTPPDPDGYTTRGGAYDTPYTGLTCGFTSAIFPDTFVFPNLGFRCCRDAN